ncbi:MAG: mechanosensitive ion channel [Oscillatoriales cyanobacterium RM2_1_1]|nr:mechanosensitive ion channel [Oscillatoriales cyanobacterium SM2_3_0]NJO44231.1 mechanosensitive ion channel [Oscillatoriales cyanobacterium RM2_1_1]
MNGTWYEIPQLIEVKLPTLSHLHLAQNAVQDTTNAVQDTTSRALGGINTARIWDIVLAVGLLFVGWLVALFAQSLTRNLLKKTSFDNRLASWMSGGDGSGEDIPIENWIATAVFWIIFLLAIIGFLDRLQFGGAVTPLTSFISEITDFLPNLLGAALLLGLAWVLATVAKSLVLRLLDSFGLDEKLNQQVTPPSGQARTNVGTNVGTTTGTYTGTTGTSTGTTPGQRIASTPGRTTTSNQSSLSTTLANTLYWLIFLLFLPAILSTLGLDGLLAPVQDMVNRILAILPNIFAAVLIAGAGWIIAQIVRRIVTNLLAATGIDNFGRRFGFGGAAGGQSLSGIIGTIVFVLILIPIAIAALERLKINAISEPAIAMLNSIFDIIPQIFAASVILVVAYFIARFVADLVTSILTSLGFNNLLYWLGLESTPYQATPEPIREQARDQFGQPLPAQDRVDTFLQGKQSTARTPSEILGLIAGVAVMLFAVVTATDILNLNALTVLVGQVISIAGHVLVGLAVFAVGLYFANLAFKFILNTGSPRFLAQAARIAIIVFVGAMALEQMRVAPDIVNLAFGLLLGAIAVAIAIAYGLGGRDVAGEQLRDFFSGLKK